MIGIEYIPCFHVLGMPVGKREYFLLLILIALLLLWEYELQLRNEDAVKLSRYIFEKVLKVCSEQAGFCELADNFGCLLWITAMG